MNRANSPGDTVGTKNSLRMAIVIAGALAILTCIVFKASQASMTHDESSTYLNLVQGSTLNLFTCHYNPACWTTANNHLLNTLLVRWSVSMFGTSELAMRLPNLLMLLVYLACVISILRDTGTTASESLFGIAVLTCNPFVLDFFALARGYGMGVGFVMLSVFALWRYVSRDRAGYMVLALVAGIAAVFANLTCIAFVAALAGASLLHHIITIRQRQGKVRIIIPALIACCLLFLCWYFYRPVLILINLGEFEYGAKTLWESWRGFARDSLYGVDWFGDRTIDSVAIGSAVLLGLCAVVSWLPIRREDKRVEAEFGRILCLLFLMLAAFFVLSNVFTGAYYPSGRKTILVFPIAALFVYFTSKRFIRGKHLLNQLSLAIVSLLLITHFVRTFNGHTYREWWYDASTKDMIYFISEKAAPGDSISLGVEWVFHPSTNFYVMTRQLPVNLAPYSKDISKDDPVMYYYLHPDQANALEPEFVLEKNFEGRWLMKRQ